MRVIVSVADHARQIETMIGLREAGFTIRRSMFNGRILAGDIPDGALTVLESLPGIESVEAEQEFTAQ